MSDKIYGRAKNVSIKPRCTSSHGVDEFISKPMYDVLDWLRGDRTQRQPLLSAMTKNAQPDACTREYDSGQGYTSHVARYLFIRLRFIADERNDASGREYREQRDGKQGERGQRCETV